MATFVNLLNQVNALAWVKRHPSEMEIYLRKEELAKLKCPLGFGVTQISISGPSDYFCSSVICEIVELAAAKILAEGYYNTKYAKIAHLITQDHPCKGTHIQALNRLREANDSFQKACHKYGLKASWEMPR